MSSFIDSGEVLVLSIWFVLAVVLYSENNFIAKLTVWVWCSYNEWTDRLHVYSCSLANRLHDEAAELCLPNS